MSRSLYGAALLPLVLACSPTGSSEDMGPPPPDPQVRIGHFLDGFPALDLCIKANGDYIGPLALTKLMRSGGVPFGYTSGYFSLPGAQYSVRVVSGMSTDCATPFLGLPDIKIDEIKAGHRYTIAGAGNISSGNYRFLTIEDDNSVVAGQARLRFVHAISAGFIGPVDLGSGSGGSFATLLSADNYGEVGSAGGEPYVTLAPTTNATYAARSRGASGDFKVFMNKVTLAADTVYTATVTTYVGATLDYQLSLCNDTAAATSGLAQCMGLK